MAEYDVYENNYRYEKYINALLKTNNITQAIHTEKNSSYSDHEFAKFVGRNFHKRITDDRIIYFGPCFSNTSLYQEYHINTVLYVIFQHTPRDAYPDFFVMLYESHNNDIKCVINFFTNNIYKSFSNISNINSKLNCFESLCEYKGKKNRFNFSNCTKEQLIDFEKKYDFKYFIVEYFNNIGNLTHNVNRPDRISSLIFDFSFKNIISCNFDEYIIEIDKTNQNNIDQNNTNQKSCQIL
jgi:hypothetical protein